MSTGHAALVALIHGAMLALGISMIFNDGWWEQPTGCVLVMVAFGFPIYLLLLIAFRMTGRRPR